jgi:hypothetical protein
MSATSIRRALERENARWSNFLTLIPESDWTEDMRAAQRRPVEAWRSRHFALMVYPEANGVERLSICRAAIAGDRWQDGIAWDDLMELKRQCGRGEKCAVEILPPDHEIVNVANMRHLWVLPYSPPFMWSKK